MIARAKRNKVTVLSRQNAAAAVRHRDALQLSSQITQTLRRMYWPETSMITPDDVIKVLHRAKVTFVLMGTYGINGWRYQPRATQDVDVLVRKSHLAKAVRELKKAFPELTVKDLPAVIRFVDPAKGREVIDVMKPLEDLYQEAFRHTVAVGKSHCVPDLEMALAAKFAAIQSPYRSPGKKLTDGGDFTEIAQHNYDKIDLDKLFSLGEMACDGGGKKILEYVEDAHAGRIIKMI